jgi:hypothetical protein
MIIEYALTRAGVEYSLSDGSLAYVIGEDGFGMAEVRRHSSRGPQQHGDTDVGYLIEPRIFTLVIDLPGSSAPDLRDKKDVLYGILTPGTDTVRVSKTVDGVVRVIDCHLVGGLPMATGDKNGFTQRVAITFKAPDPAFYDPVGWNLVFALGGGSGGGTVPRVIPRLVGSSVLNASASKTYTGTMLSYPQVRITGPITDPVLRNNITGEKLDFTGITITGGDYYDIDCRYGKKTIVDSGGVNRIANLTDDSDLATFHIAAHPAAPGGVNSFTATGTAVTAATSIELVGLTRFVGV